MTTETVAKLTIDISPDLQNLLKTTALAKGKSLKAYVLDTLTESVEKDSLEEDRLLAEASELAKQEGSLSEQDSKSLLALMKNA